jgi:hypothetical protein
MKIEALKTGGGALPPTRAEIHHASMDFSVTIKQAYMVEINEPKRAAPPTTLPTVHTLASRH